MSLFSNSDKPLFKTNYLGFWIRVYANRVEFKSNVGRQSIPINQIASVQLGMFGFMKITIESTGGKKYSIPCIKKREVQEAIYEAQSSTSNQLSPVSVADEILKLTTLKDNDVISLDEFNEQKNKLLSIK